MTQKLVNGTPVDLSSADLAQQTADAAAWSAGATLRALAAVDQACGMTRWQRDTVISALASSHPQRIKAAAAEVTAASLRSQL